MSWNYISTKAELDRRRSWLAKQPLYYISDMLAIAVGGILLGMCVGFIL